MTFYAKIFGMPRSGTNFVKGILEQNIIGLQVHQNVGRWKHAFVYAEDIKRMAMPTVTCIKNPYHHLYSLFEYPRNFHGNDVLAIEYDSFDEFLKRPVTFYQHRNDPAQRMELRFSNPVQWWNTFSWHYAALVNPAGNLLVPHDRFVLDPLPYIKTLANFVRSRIVDEPCLRISRRVQPSGEQLRFGDSYDSEFQRKRLYEKRFSKTSVEFVNSQLDRELMERCGFEFLATCPD